MGMSVDVLEQTPDNVGNTLEQLKPWEERVPEKDKDTLNRVFNKLNIHRSFDQGNWNSEKDSKLAEDVAKNTRKIKEIENYLMNGLTYGLNFEIGNNEGLRRQVEENGYYTDPLHVRKEVFSGSQIEPYKA